MLEGALRKPSFRVDNPIRCALHAGREALESCVKAGLTRGSSAVRRCVRQSAVEGLSIARATIRRAAANHAIEGRLRGIVGQCLLFDHGAFNAAKRASRVVQVERCDSEAFAPQMELFATTPALPPAGGKP